MRKEIQRSFVARANAQLREFEARFPVFPRNWPLSDYNRIVRTICIMS